MKFLFLSCLAIWLGAVHLNAQSVYVTKKKQYAQVKFSVMDACYDHLIDAPFEVLDERREVQSCSSDGYYNLIVGRTYFVSCFYFRENKNYCYVTSFYYFVTADNIQDEIIKIPRICFFSSLSLSPSGIYYDCNKLCEGRCIDFHDNGKIRLKGRFKAGQPVGKLKFYNVNGVLSEMWHYNKQGQRKKMTVL